MTMRQDFRSARVSRREAMRLLGVGAGFGMLSAGGGAGLAEAAWQRTAAAGAKPLMWPQGAIIRTLLNDLLPDAIGTGATLVHEHMSLTNWRQPASTRRRRWMQDVDLIVEEMRAARADGVSCIVDVGHADMGRSLDDLMQISIRSGMHIVGSGGYYSQESYPHQIIEMPDEKLVDHLVEEANQGHLGAFGEIGTSVEITPDERKMLLAIGKAHVRTGLPIITHADGKKGAEKTPLQALDIYESVGVKPQSILSGHLDNFDDPQLHAAVAKRGAFLGFDHIGLGGPEREAQQLRNVMKAIEAGHADKVLFSGDFALDSNTKRSGGGGYALPVTKFAPKLRAAGVDEKTLHGILVDNPRRLLAFVPKMAGAAPRA